MSALQQQLLLQAVISFVGGLLGGGLISTYLDWRRFRREQVELAKEEQRIAVDSIRSVISVSSWRAKDDMSDKQQLYILKNSLQGTVREYAIVVEFVIRNLTNDEVIVTRVDVHEEGGPARLDTYLGESGAGHQEMFTAAGVPYVTAKDTDWQFYDMQAFYDPKTKSEIEIEQVTLKPKGALAFAYVAVRRGFAIRPLSEPPASVTLIVHSTEGHKVVKELGLEMVERLPRWPNCIGDYKAPKGSYEWREYEEEIPF